MRVASAFVVAICSMWLLSQPAFAEKRVALVFGNSAYQNAALLSNPANDASAMAAMLKGAGFDVVILKSYFNQRNAPIAPSSILTMRRTETIPPYT
jgi:Caspase domain